MVAENTAGNSSFASKIRLGLVGVVIIAVVIVMIYSCLKEPKPSLDDLLIIEMAESYCNSEGKNIKDKPFRFADQHIAFYQMVKAVRSKNVDLILMKSKDYLKSKDMTEGIPTDAIKDLKMLLPETKGKD